MTPYQISGMVALSLLCFVNVMRGHAKLIAGQPSLEWHICAMVAAILVVVVV